MLVGIRRIRRPPARGLRGPTSLPSDDADASSAADDTDDTNNAAAADAAAAAALQAAEIEALSRLGRHTILSTATGAVLSCGSNACGVVDPLEHMNDDQVLAKPRSLVESLGSARIVSVSFGFEHTATVVVRFASRRVASRRVALPAAITALTQVNDKDGCSRPTRSTVGLM